MTARYSVGAAVRTRRERTAQHTRLPRYLRGRTGTIVAVAGAFPVADDRAAGIAALREMLYTVAFGAAPIFAGAVHRITADLWERYLEPVE